MTTSTDPLRYEPDDGRLSPPEANHSAGDPDAGRQRSHADDDVPEGPGASLGASTGTDKTTGGNRPISHHPYEDEARFLIDRRRPTAAHGWRRVITKLTGGRINPGPNAEQREAAELIGRIRASLDDVHKVAFVSSKGGVGKSTMTVAVGNVIARARGDRVIAVDVDPDLGDLSTRFTERGGPQANIAHMAALQNIERYARVRLHTVINTDRLELLAAQNDPKATYALGPEDYVATMKNLDFHFNVIMLDCGTSITDPLFAKIADDVTALVVVASQDVRGVEGALATLEWLYAHGFDGLLQHTVVALNAIRSGKPLIDLEAVENEFSKLVPEVFRVPYDRHLAEGVAVDLGALKSRTRKAVLELAGGVAHHYPTSQTQPYRGDDVGAWLEMIR